MHEITITITCKDSDPDAIATFSEFGESVHNLINGFTPYESYNSTCVDMVRNALLKGTLKPNELEELIMETELKDEVTIPIHKVIQPEEG